MGLFYKNISGALNFYKPSDLCGSNRGEGFCKTAFCFETLLFALPLGLIITFSSMTVFTRQVAFKPLYGL